MIACMLRTHLKNKARASKRAQCHVLYSLVAKMLSCDARASSCCSRAVYQCSSTVTLAGSSSSSSSSSPPASSQQPAASKQQAAAAAGSTVLAAFVQGKETGLNRLGDKSLRRAAAVASGVATHGDLGAWPQFASMSSPEWSHFHGSPDHRQRV